MAQRDAEGCSLLMILEMLQRAVDACDGGMSQALADQMTRHPDYEAWVSGEFDPWTSGEGEAE